MDDMFKMQDTANIERKDLSNQSTLRFMDHGELLRTKLIPDDSTFEGVVYITRSYVRPSLYNEEKFDGTFHMIDADGVKFPAYFNNMDCKFESHHSCAYVKGVKHYRINRHGTSVVTYRLNYITQSTIDEPLSMFLKEIDQYVPLCNQLDQFLRTSITDTSYQTLVNDAAKMGLLSALKKETLADTYGTKVGMRIQFFFSAVTMINAAAGTVEINKELVYLALLLKLWKPVDVVNDVELNAYREDNYIAEHLVHESSLAKEDKIKLLGMLKGTNNCIESYLVKSVYDVLDTMAYKKEYLSQTPGDSIGIFC